MSAGDDGPGVAILLVCTGNLCRSPMAEGLLRRHLDDAGIPAEVASAGLTGEGQPADPRAAEALAARGIDLSAHRNRRLGPEHTAAADLVVAMTREHLREVAVVDPGAWARTFTLKELVRRAERHGPRPAGVALDAWLARLAEGRSTAELVGAAPEDDVEDPIGRPPEAFEATVAELDALLAEAVELLWPR